MNLLVKMIDRKELVGLRQVFNQIDKDGTGEIDAKSLSAYLKSRGEKISDSEVKKLIKEVDYSGNGKINYNEFLTATIDHTKFLTEQRMRAIFNQFDTDSTERITASNLKEAFLKMGKKMTTEEVE